MQSTPIDPRSPVAVQRTISDWDAESWALHDEKFAAFLADEAEDFEIRLTVDIPGPRPTLAELTYYLESINRRVTLALNLTFQPERYFAPNDRYFFLEERNYHNSWLNPVLKVEEIGVSSAHIVIRGTTKEIREAVLHFDAPPPPKTLKKRLIGGIIVACAALGIGPGPDIGPAPVPVPVEIAQEVRDDVNRTCGLLPAGTTLTVKTPLLEMTVPCGAEKAGEPQRP